MDSGRVDVVVVYKVDRLSRSLADFARLMQTFDQRSVSFVSVTQQFNTTTSMGRLTLNMLLSFAQFEREVTGERIRDKIAATKRRGVWVCGQPPLGYRLPHENDPGFTPGDRVLRVIEPEAELVRAIFRGYLELGSPVRVAAKLNAEGQTTRRWVSSRGVEHGGRPLNAAFIHRVLTNPVYTSMITHTRGRHIPGSPKQTECHPGLHEPIIDPATWDRVHARMRTVERAARQSWTHTHLLKGKLRTFEGHAMSPGSVQRPVSKRAETRRALGPEARRVVRYYVSQKAVKQGYKTCPIRTVNAARLDGLIRGVVLGHLRSGHHAELDAWAPEARDRWVREVIHRVVVAPDRVGIELLPDRIAACVEAAREAPHAPATRADGEPAPIPACPFTPELDDRGPRPVLTLRVQIRRHDGRRELRSPEGHDLRTVLAPDARPRPLTRLVRAIGRAYAWRRELLEPGATIDGVAQRAGVSPSRLHALLPLTQLSPAILRAVFKGTIRPGTTLTELLHTAQQLDWSHQDRALSV